jgi:hypothetical protein
MAPSIFGLSSLEIEPLEMPVNASGQEKSLTISAESEVVALFSCNGALPLNHHQSWISYI